MSTSIIPVVPPPAPLPTPTNHTRTGKVARLPRATRDQINTMILDGVPYLTIIEKLGPAAEGLTENNLSTWKAGGYLDWLRERQLMHALQTKYEFAQSVLAQAADDNAAGHALLHSLALNLTDLLAETDVATLRQNLFDDPDKFTRLVNSMVRLADGGIRCELHKFYTQDRAAHTAKANSPAAQSGISDESLRKAEEKLNLL